MIKYIMPLFLFLLFSESAFAQNHSNDLVLVGEIGKTISAYRPCEVAEADCRADKLQKVELNAFYIDRYEATYRDVKACYDDGRCSDIHVIALLMAFEGDAAKADFPYPLDYETADAYCRARGMRLPTPEEWLLAAMGAQIQNYPWGDELMAGMFADAVAAVGQFPRDVSVWGVYDMAGNATEWVSGDVMGHVDSFAKCGDDRTWPSMGNVRRVKIYERFGVGLFLNVDPVSPAVRCVRDASTK